MAQDDLSVYSMTPSLYTVYTTQCTQGSSAHLVGVAQDDISVYSMTPPLYTLYSVHKASLLTSSAWPRTTSLKLSSRFPARMVFRVVPTSS